MDVEENHGIQKFWKITRYIGLVFGLMLLISDLKVLFLAYLDYDRDQYPVFYIVESLLTIPYLLIPLSFVVFLIISIVVAFRTKLKTVESKRLLFISAILLLLTAVLYIIFVLTPNPNDYNDFSSLLEMHLVILHVANFIVSSIALSLYVISYNIYSICTKFNSYNIYSICTKFKAEGSKTYFFISLASMALLLSIAGIIFLKLS